MAIADPSTAPSMGVVVVKGRIAGSEVGRLDAELTGRIAVGTQVLVVDVGEANFVDLDGLGVLAGAAKQLQDERLGSMVLRNAGVSFLRQLRLLRLDHVFELEA